MFVEGGHSVLRVGSLSTLLCDEDLRAEPRPTLNPQRERIESATGSPPALMREAVTAAGSPCIR